MSYDLKKDIDQTAAAIAGLEDQLYNHTTHLTYEQAVEILNVLKDNLVVMQMMFIYNY